MCGIKLFKRLMGEKYMLPKEVLQHKTVAGYLLVKCFLKFNTFPSKGSHSPLNKLRLLASFAEVKLNL